MVNFDKNLITSIIIYLSSCAIFYNYKPEKMFDEDKNFKSFGLNKDETIFPFWLITSLIGISSYYLLVIRNSNNIETFF